MFGLFLYKKILEPSKDFEQPFLVIGITVTIFFVSFILTPLLLVFRKVKLRNMKLSCITKASVDIYALTLLGIFTLALDFIFAGAMNMPNLLTLLSFTFLPIALACCFAIIHYQIEERAQR